MSDPTSSVPETDQEGSEVAVDSNGSSVSAFHYEGHGRSLFYFGSSNQLQGYDVLFEYIALAETA